ncbi:ABC transporter permease [Chachezhania antarctica]|uniref:ABC transporter permease n=1 Tax=Chachezhania antarctica TaxID=2340860 RepID=UPI000EB50B50|nr:ABC transporter permease [Chachezhania antarctica]|tara:strand:+ start:4952 stop:5986 length:1035 start_codon:yes stop_codon:yes gene_type:complete
MTPTSSGRTLPFAAIALATAAVFLLAAATFFIAIGQAPLRAMIDLVLFATGDAFSRVESLLKAAPILLCAIAAAIPGRLGLISVGAEGQLHLGAIFGTALVLAMPQAPAIILLPATLLAAAVGGALWGGVPGWLRGRLSVNETITTLVMNYLGILMVNGLVFGPWRDPANLGWPATASFPDAARLPVLPGTGLHLGLFLGVLLALGCAFAFSRGIRAERVRVLAMNRKVGETYGLNFPRFAVILMATGGAAAGLAGICEAIAVQGRLQPGLSLGYGLTGFLVAWLCGHRFLLILPVSILVGGLLAAGDSLQLFHKIPASSATILQGLLFVTVLAVPGVLNRRAS